MVVLVIGGQNSGKSAFAEDIVVRSGIDRRYYLATMKVCDEAGEERILRHRRQREGKGFITIELPYGIERAAELMEDAGNSIVLLECIANLVGNEIYDNPKNGRTGIADAEELVSSITNDIERLADSVKELVIVTSEYDKNDTSDGDTRRYIEMIDKVNERLEVYADRVFRI